MMYFTSETLRSFYLYDTKIACLSFFDSMDKYIVEAGLKYCRIAAQWAVINVVCETTQRKCQTWFTYPSELRTDSP